MPPITVSTRIATIAKRTRLLKNLNVIPSAQSFEPGPEFGIQFLAGDFAPDVLNYAFHRGHWKLLFLYRRDERLLIESFDFVIGYSNELPEALDDEFRKTNFLECCLPQLIGRHVSRIPDLSKPLLQCLF